MRLRPWAIDEESSDIIDAEKHLGKGTFVFDAQVHTAKNLPLGTGPGTVQEFVEKRPAPGAQGSGLGRGVRRLIGRRSPAAI